MLGDVYLMKNSFLKTVASVVVATTLLFTTATCFAANANTVTTYTNGEVQVTSTITDVPSGDMVTYLASKTGTVNDKSDVVYITQWTSDGSDKTVSYTVKGATLGNVAAVVKYGSDVADTASALNTADTTKTVKVSQVTVTKDDGVASVTDGYATTSTAASITVELKSGYEFDTVEVNGSVVALTGSNVFQVPMVDNPTLEIVTKQAQSSVNVATIQPLDNVDVYVDGTVIPSLGIVAQITGTTTGVEYGIYVENASGAFKFDANDTNGGFYRAANANEDGYFAVNIASGLLDGAGYVAYPYYKIGSEAPSVNKAPIAQ